MLILTISNNIKPVFKICLSFNTIYKKSIINSFIQKIAIQMRRAVTFLSLSFSVLVSAEVVDSNKSWIMPDGDNQDDYNCIDQGTKNAVSINNSSTGSGALAGQTQTIFTSTGSFNSQQQTNQKTQTPPPLPSKTGTPAVGSYNGALNGNDNSGGYNGNTNGNINQGNQNGNVNGNQNGGDSNGSINGNMNQGNQNGNLNGNQNDGSYNGNANGNQNFGDQNGIINGNANSGNDNGNQNGNANQGDTNGSFNGNSNTGSINGNGNGNYNQGSVSGNLNGNNNDDNLNGNRNGSFKIGNQQVDVQLDVQEQPPTLENTTGNGNFQGNQLLSVNQNQNNGDGNRGNNNGNVIINGDAPVSSSSGANQFFANAKGDASGNGQTKITLRANQDQNGDGVKGDQILTIDATGTGQTTGNVETQGQGDFGMGNLNGNGNGNTLLNIDFYDYEGKDNDLSTQAHVSSASPMINTIQRYAGSAVDILSTFFSK